MCLLCHELRLQLAHVVTRAGFVLTGSEGATEDVGQLASLEYRAEYADRRILLDIYQVTARRTVSATLWSPADLARADLEAGIQAIAI